MCEARKRRLAALSAGLALGLGVCGAWAEGPPAPARRGPAEVQVWPDPADVPGTPAAPDPAAAPEKHPAPPARPACVPIDLPTALRLVNASNPTVALARARVEEAYAR